MGLREKAFLFTQQARISGTLLDRLPGPADMPLAEPEGLSGFRSRELKKQQSSPSDASVGQSELNHINEPESQDNKKFTKDLPEDLDHESLTDKHSQDQDENITETIASIAYELIQVNNMASLADLVMISFVSLFKASKVAFFCFPQSYAKHMVCLSSRGLGDIHDTIIRVAREADPGLLLHRKAKKPQMNLESSRLESQDNGKENKYDERQNLVHLIFEKIGSDFFLSCANDHGLFGFIAFCLPSDWRLQTDEELDALDLYARFVASAIENCQIRDLVESDRQFDLIYLQTANSNQAYGDLIWHGLDSYLNHVIGAEKFRIWLRSESKGFYYLQKDNSTKPSQIGIVQIDQLLSDTQSQRRGRSLICQLSGPVCLIQPLTEGDSTKNADLAYFFALKISDQGNIEILGQILAQDVSWSEYWQITEKIGYFNEKFLAWQVNSQKEKEPTEDFFAEIEDRVDRFLASGKLVASLLFSIKNLRRFQNIYGSKKCRILLNNFNHLVRQATDSRDALFRVGYDKYLILFCSLDIPTIEDFANNVSLTLKKIDEANEFQILATYRCLLPNEDFTSGAEIIAMI